MMKFVYYQLWPISNETAKFHQYRFIPFKYMTILPRGGPFTSRQTGENVTFFKDDRPNVFKDGSRGYYLWRVKLFVASKTQVDFCC